MAQAVEEQLHSRDQEDVIPAVVTAVSGGCKIKKKNQANKKNKSSKIKRAAEFYLDASEGVLTGLAPGAPALAPPQLGCGFQRWGTDPA